MFVSIVPVGTITQGICELLLTVALLIGSDFNNLWHVRSSYIHWHEVMLDFLASVELLFSG